MNLITIFSHAAAAAATVAETVAETAAETSPYANMVPEDFTFDYSLRVPVLSIVMMIISLAVIIGVPVFIFLYTKKRFQFQLYPVTAGFLACLLGVTMLPQLIMNLFALIPALGNLMDAHPLGSDLFYIALVAILSFAAMYIGLRLSYRKTQESFATAIYFGTAMGIIPILTQGFSNLVSYVSAAFSINQGKLSETVASMIESSTTSEDIESIQQGLDSMTAFINEPSIDYLIVGLDLVLQLIFFVGISIMLLTYISNAAAKKALYMSLIGQGIFTIAFVLRVAVFSDSILICELLNLITAAAAIILAWMTAREFLPDSLEKLLGKPDPTLNNGQDPKDPPHKMPKIVMPKD